MKRPLEAAGEGHSFRAGVGGLSLGRFGHGVMPHLCRDGR